MTQLDNGCFVFNLEGNLKQKGDGESTLLTYTTSDDDDGYETNWLLLFIANFDEPKTRLIEQAQHAQGPGVYNIFLEKEVFNRLPAPYPSKCSVNGIGSDNLMETKYNRRNCRESCAIRNMFNKCGTVVDAFQQYFANDTLMTSTIASEEDTRQCLSESLENMMFSPPLGCKCPYPCSDVIYKHSMQKHYGEDDVKAWDFYLHYKQRRVTYITEKPLMSITEALANLGGIKSLLVGTSILSFVEVIIFIGMRVARSIKQIKNVLRKKETSAAHRE